MSGIALSVMERLYSVDLSRTYLLFRKIKLTRITKAACQKRVGEHIAFSIKVLESSFGWRQFCRHSICKHMFHIGME